MKIKLFTTDLSLFMRIFSLFILFLSIFFPHLFALRLFLPIHYLFCRISFLLLSYFISISLITIFPFRAAMLRGFYTDWTYWDNYWKWWKRPRRQPWKRRLSLWNRLRKLIYCWNHHLLNRVLLLSYHLLLPSPCHLLCLLHRFWPFPSPSVCSGIFRP